MVIGANQCMEYLHSRLTLNAAARLVAVGLPSMTGWCWRLPHRENRPAMLIGVSGKRKTTRQSSGLWKKRLTAFLTFGASMYSVSQDDGGSQPSKASVRSGASVEMVSRIR